MITQKITDNETPQNRMRAVDGTQINNLEWP